MDKKSAFEQLYALNVNEHTEKKKNGKVELTYLSWAYAWAEIKKIYPEATYTIFKNEGGLPYVYDPSTGYMVYTTVTIDNLTYEMWLPVMDGANKAMKAEPYQYKNRYNEVKTVEAASMFDINKTIMRCLVKNLAMFGLGLYIFAGEDLPEGEEEEVQPLPQLKEDKPKKTTKKAAAPKVEETPQQAAPSAPSREEMLSLARKKYPEGSDCQKQILKLWNIESLDKASTAQLMVIWNKYA